MSVPSPLEQAVKASKPEYVDIATPAQVDRFWSHVRKDADGCWRWTAATTKGYGMVHLRVDGDDYAYQAHRVAWVLLRGRIGGGLTIDHLCRNPGCVNPDHMEPVPMGVNTARGIGPTAVNAAKTHCKFGHEYTPENTVQGSHGRECLACRRQRDRTRHALAKDYQRVKDRADAAEAKVQALEAELDSALTELVRMTQQSNQNGYAAVIENERANKESQQCIDLEAALQGLAADMRTEYATSGYRRLLHYAERLKEALVRPTEPQKEDNA